MSKQMKLIKSPPMTVETVGGTYPVEELRLRADQALMRGEREYALIMHTLIDMAEGGRMNGSLQAQVIQAQADMRELEAAQKRIYRHARDAEKLLKKVPPKVRDALETALTNIINECC